MAELMKVFEQANNNTIGVGECLVDTDENISPFTTLFIRTMMPNLNITRTCTVQNNYLKAMYELKKEEYKVLFKSEIVREIRMYHSTSAHNAMSIIKDNLDWRRVSRVKYGQGVSFSTDPDYANFHSNSNNGSSRAFIIADVLVGNTCLGSAAMNVPGNKMDTAISSNRNVYVKFNDHEFLPMYVVFYDAPDRTTSRHFRQHRRRHFLW